MPGYAAKGMIGAFGLIAVVVSYGAIDRALNWTMVDGTVGSVTRMCDFHSDIRHSVDEAIRQDCESSPSFASIRDRYNQSNGKNVMGVVGTASVNLRYNSPDDGSMKSGQLQVDSDRAEFYKLGPGDKIKVYASKSDPTKLTLP